VHPSIFHARHPVVTRWSEDRPLIPLEHAVALHRKVDSSGEPDVDINPIYVEFAH
jgi:hypothetical protein